MTVLRRDRYRDLDLYCRPPQLPPTCIHREKRKTDGTVFARPHSKDRGSNQSCCEEFVAVREDRARRQSTIPDDFAADPEWHLEKVSWFAQLPIQSPTATHPTANRSPESRLYFLK